MTGCHKNLSRSPAKFHGHFTILASRIRPYLEISKAYHKVNEANFCLNPYRSDDVNGQMMDDLRFMSVLTVQVFKSHLDDRWVIMKGCVQWTKKGPGFWRDSNPGPLDQQASA